jgi:hypothetical protein
MFDRCLAASCSSSPFPQPTDSDFADLVLYYAHGLVKRHTRMKRAVFWVDTATKRKEDVLDFDFEMAGDIESGEHNNKALYYQWVKDRHARGTFSHANLKQDMDREAFMLALYIIAQHDLKSFHPDVRNDESHEHNAKPCLNMSRKDAFYVVKILGVTAVCQETTTKEYRLLQAAKIRDILLSAKHRIGTHMRCGTEFAYEMDWLPDRLTSAKTTLLEELNRRRAPKHVEETALALCMGTHSRLGESSFVSILSREILEMIIETWFTRDVKPLDQFADLLQ